MSLGAIFGAGCPHSLVELILLSLVHSQLFSYINSLALWATLPRLPLIIAALVEKNRCLLVSALPLQVVVLTRQLTQLAGMNVEIPYENSCL